MGKFRARAAEIKAAGDAERGNFDPSGTPLNIYNYWLANATTPHAKGVRNGHVRENFCHFWRVVAIWAPLMFLRKQAAKVLDNEILVAALCALALVGLAYSFAYAGNWLGIVFWTCVAALGLMVTLGVVWTVRKFWKPQWTSKAVDIVVYGFALAAAVAAIAVIVSLVIQNGLIVLLILAGLILGALIFVLFLAFLFSSLEKFLSGRRALAREAEEKRILAARLVGRDPFEKTPKPRGRISKFFTSFGDLFIFTFQVIRVSKWKICPVVEIQPDKIDR